MASFNLEDLESDLCKLPIIKKIIERLQQDLAPNLKYHSAAHTLDVIHEALLFATTDKISERELHLLAIAAAYHDAGFLVRPLANEVLGADFAQVAMIDQGGYSKKEVALVSEMIIDTEIFWGHEGPVFKSSNELSGYLLDADLSNFGRVDFFDKSKLFAEETNQTFPQVKASMIIFLKKHMWHTRAAFKLREEQKQKNLKMLVIETST